MKYNNIWYVRIQSKEKAKKLGNNIVKGAGYIAKGIGYIAKGIGYIALSTVSILGDVLESIDDD